MRLSDRVELAIPGIQNRAIAPHETPTSEESWDAAANVARLRSGEDAGYYGRMYAWRDPDGDATTKAAYKFPHHHVDGDGNPGAAVLIACSAGIAALNGGRGGAAIPDADRRGVYRHLAKHLRDGDREPPPLQDRADGEARSRAWLARSQRRGDWYRMVENRAQDETEVWIYDEIGPWFAVTAKDFVRALQDVQTSTIKLRLHSPGGEIFDSIAIYRALLDHPARVDVYVDALAASSASVIAMAGDRIVMSRHARMMIHEPYGLVLGDAGDMRDLAAQLDSLGDEIASIYQERAGGTVSEWRDKMRAETWFTDQGAVDSGLADELGEPATKVTNHFDLSVFARVPEDLQHAYREPETREMTRREAEQALREAGLPRDAAKAVLDRGWGWKEREAPPAPLTEPPGPSPFRVQLETDLLELAVT